MNLKEIEKQGTNRIRNYSKKAEIMAVVQFEDMVQWALYERPPVPLPAVMPKARIEFTPTAALIFGRQTFKKTMGIIMP